MRETLESIGMTPNEATIYLALLDTGESAVGAIADKTGLHRRTIYDCLERLGQKGFVGSSVKEHTKVYIATDPKKLLTYIKEKERKLEEIMPNLVSMSEESKEKVTVNVFRGREGIKTSMDDKLNYNEPTWVVGVGSRSPKILKFWAQNYHQRRIEKGLGVRNIYYTDSMERGRAFEKLKYTDVRYMKRKRKSDLTMSVYADKVVFNLWSEGEPFSIMIQNREIADGFRNIYDAIWDTSYLPKDIDDKGNVRKNKKTKK